MTMLTAELFQFVEKLFRAGNDIARFAEKRFKSKVEGERTSFYSNGSKVRYFYVLGEYP